MKLVINCDDNNGVGLNKKNYLMNALCPGNVELVSWTPQIGAEAEYLLNIEPYTFKQGKKWTGVWEIDLLLDRQEMSETNWALSDTIFTAISTIPDRLQKYKDKTRLLFQAVDPTIHKVYDVPKECDIAFSGDMHSPVYTERERVYNILKKNYNFKGFDKTNTANYIKNINSARIQFIRSMSTPLNDGELAQRFFECLAIGPVVTNYVDDLKHTGLVESVDYFAYKNDDEMILKINHLLQNPEFAQTMAENGRKKAQLYHTYSHRLATILQTIYDFNNNSN